MRDLQNVANSIGVIELSSITEKKFLAPSAGAIVRSPGSKPVCDRRILSLKTFVINLRIRVIAISHVPVCCSEDRHMLWRHPTREQGN